MDKIGVGILTYKRYEPLCKLTESIVTKCSYDYLLVSNDDRDNQGVAVNSNRLIKGLYDRGCDFIFILNDDVLALGDFTQLYVDASKDTGIDHFSFRRPALAKVEDDIKINNTELTVLYSITGNMLFLTRNLVDKIGYFDTNYGKYVEEHVDYTKRANLSGAFKDVKVHVGRSLDVKKSIDLLSTQEFKSSVEDKDKSYWHTIASTYNNNKWNTPIKKVPLYVPFCDRIPY